MPAAGGAARPAVAGAKPAGAPGAAVPGKAAGAGKPASAAAKAGVAAAQKPAPEPEQFPPLNLPDVAGRHEFFANMLSVMTSLYDFTKQERKILEAREYDKLTGMPARKEVLINLFAECVGNLRARDELKSHLKDPEYEQIMQACRTIKMAASSNMKLLVGGINAVNTVIESVVNAAKDANPGKIGIYGGDGAVGSSGIENRHAPVSLNKDI